MSESPTGLSPELDRLCIDAVRVLAMDAVQKAKSGHPGTPMALAPLGYLLWTRHLRHNPADPAWADRDRFVLSVGHASMLLYSLLHLTGYDLSMEEIVNFRQWGSLTPGHPELKHTAGVETTTGPLGQGVANSVGMALAERWLAARFNRPGHDVVDHYTYAICSDGDLMEGISHEVAAMAGHQKLGKLIWIFDDNRITIEGATDLSTSTDQGDRFLGYQWHVQHVDDGTDLVAIDRALTAARAATDRPSLIVMTTRIGEGSPNKVGHHSTHGAPLGDDEISATKTNLGYPSHEPFHVDPEGLTAWRTTADRGGEIQADWATRFEAYRSEHPELAEEFKRMMAGELAAGWDAEVPTYETVDKAAATRSWSGKVLQAVASGVPNLIGGSADLGSSNMTDIDGGGDLSADNPDGRIIHFGIREHGMAGVMNGLALHGGIRPFGGTFLIFSDYMRPSIRLAALMGLPVTYVFTHDSIGLGEDGPTHQPIEHLMSLRAMPNLLDLRPADAAETAVAWRIAMERTDGPTWLSLTRQGVPPLDRTVFASATEVRRGAYVLAEASGSGPEVVLIASGSEIGIALDAKEALEAAGTATRVVSMPSWYLFAQQDQSYHDLVLPPDVRARVAVEAGSTFGWARWIGATGAAVGIDHFGASAPAETLYERFGVTTENVVAAARASLEKVAVAPLR
ncbi:MAG: transketolase [Gemmatimonadetes bacterium]|nr:transketolase [Gemmatimonadota bacterium]